MIFENYDRINDLDDFYECFPRIIKKILKNEDYFYLRWKPYAKIIFSNWRNDTFKIIDDNIPNFAKIWDRLLENIPTFENKEGKISLDEFKNFFLEQNPNIDLKLFENKNLYWHHFYLDPDDSGFFFWFPKDNKNNESNPDNQNLEEKLSTTLFWVCNAIRNKLRYISFSNFLFQFLSISNEDKYISEYLWFSIDYLYQNNSAGLKDIQNEMIISDKMRNLGYLMTNISQELNTLLGTIISNADIIERVHQRFDKWYELQDEACIIKNDVLHKIMNIFKDVINSDKIAFDKLSSFIQNITGYSQYMNERSIWCDLRQCVMEVLDLFKPQNHNNVKIEVDFEDISELKGYPRQLKQAIFNMVLNAYQAVDEHGSIKIKINNRGPHINLIISDDGEGIEPENISRIFDPGFTTKENRRASGLGLSVAYIIFQRHFARIHISSYKGKGTEFKIRIPINPIGMRS